MNAITRPTQSTPRLTEAYKILLALLIVFSLALNGTAQAAFAKTAPADTVKVFSQPKPVSLARLNAGLAPNQPVLVAPANGATSLPVSQALSVNATDPEGDPLTVSFYGRVKTAVTSTNFKFVVLPDTQYYTVNTGGDAIFNSQTQWVVNTQAANNIVYVSHVGDLVQNYDGVPAEWLKARNAMYLLETAPANIPYGTAVGNHDQGINADPDSTTNYFNTYFGVSHFTGRSYYGGNYGSNNDNHYDLITASGVDIIIVYIEASGNPPATAVLNWANNLLQTNPNRRGIVVFHNLMGATAASDFSTAGLAVYNALKDNANLYLMLCGHYGGEAQRSDPGNGHQIYSLMADYSPRVYNGDGLLRILEFQPENNQIQVKTYRPARSGVTEQYETDADSQFTVPFYMKPAYSLIGTANVASGSNASVTWSGLANSTQYEWYAVVSDGTTSTTGATWNFSTEVVNSPHTISGNTGQGGVTLSYNDGGAKSVTSDGNGDYSLSVSYNWGGTVTPSKAGFTFSPPNRSYSNVIINQTNQDYTATAITPTISGNTGQGGVTLSYTDGSPKTVTSAANGSYSFTVSYNWNGTVTPSKTGYTFLPPSLPYSNVTTNQANQNYTATAITYTISGNAGVSGVTLSYTDGTPKTATSGTDGSYSFTVSYNWSGTVTPSKTGYTFSLPSRTYIGVLANQSGQDYTATAITYTISGNTVQDGVTLSYFDGTDKTATSGSGGSYSFTVSYNWSGTVTPSKPGFTFLPTSLPYTNVTSNRTGQNYTPTAITPTIAGNAGVSGVTLSYFDGTNKTATSGTGGSYSFTVSYNWNGTVTPSKTGYTFTPDHKDYSSVTSNQAAQDYAAKSNQTITITTPVPENAYYGSSFTAAATASSGLDVTYSASGSCVNVGALFTMTSGTGSCIVQYNQAGNGSYNPATQVTETVTAHKAALTVTADAKSKVYGDSDLALTYQVTSGTLVSPDTFSGSLSRAAGENIGTYAIQQGTLTAGSNYTMTYAGALLTISQKAITVTATSDTKTYDGTLGSAGIPVITSGGLVGADTATWTQTFDTINVGANKIITPTGTVNDQNGGKNYAVTFLPVMTGIIDRRPITVTADAQSKVVGSVDPLLTYQVTSGALASPDVFSGSLNRTPGEDIGDYAILQGTLTAGSNYDLTYVGASLEIHEPLVKTLTLTSTGTYDGWVLEMSETSLKGGPLDAKAKTFLLGDDALNRQYRAILSFDTTSLPAGAVIQSVTLRIRPSGKSVGSDPFKTLSNLLLDIKKGPFGKAALESADFQAKSVKKVSAFTKKSTGWYEATLNAAGLANINRAGLTQFRLYFTKDDNNNFKAEYMKFFSGNNSTNKPELIITYIAP